MDQEVFSGSFSIKFQPIDNSKSNADNSVDNIRSLASTMNSYGLSLPTLMSLLDKRSLQPYNDNNRNNGNDQALDLSMKSKSSPESRKRRSCSSLTSSDDEIYCREKSKAGQVKVARKLQFDEMRTSPVSGTLIRERFDIEAIHRGDIDPEFNVVEITEEAKAELAKIENRIGDFVCQLCKEIYEDAFGLAQHRCSMIVLVEYRCPECEKRFNCPANLASHRRWHKPRSEMSKTSNNNNKNNNISKLEEGNKHSCKSCHKVFRKPQSLSKHIARLHSNNNNNNGDDNNINNVINGNNVESTKEVDLMSSIEDELFCQVCNHVFLTMNQLIEHRTKNHSDTFPCPSCHEIFYSLAGLTRHNNRFHNSSQEL